MNARVRVKICGVTNEADARAAIAAGADALGFNLWPGSKRHIALDDHAAWIAALPPFVTRVAVLVNASFDDACRIAAHPAIDLVQFHGEETPDFLARFAAEGRPFIVAVRLGAAEPVDRAGELHTPHVLIDAAVPGAFGGTGSRIDLPTARAFVERHAACSVILAGGLTPENVAGAVAEVRPFAVDVASGVESAPGRKDAQKLRAFIAAARG